MICGVGINDAEYKVYEVVDGVRLRCPFYTKWSSMINRCYGKNKDKNYDDCNVCDEWLTFSNFKSWMETQDWVGKEIDKDLMVYGNKTYSPLTCTFLSDKVNTFLTSKSRNGLLAGVYKRGSRFIASLKNLDGVVTYCGSFENERDAHNAYLNKKLEFAIELSKELPEHLAEKLIDRYRSKT